MDDLRERVAARLSKLRAVTNDDKVIAADIIPMILEDAAKVADARKPVIQCMSVEPIVTACEDIAAAIRALAEPVT